MNNETATKQEVYNLFEYCYNTYFAPEKEYSNCEECPFYIECHSINAGGMTLCEVMTARTKRRM